MKKLFTAFLFLVAFASFLSSTYAQPAATVYYGEGYIEKNVGMGLPPGYTNSQVVSSTTNSNWYIVFFFVIVLIACSLCCSCFVGLCAIGACCYRMFCGFCDPCPPPCPPSPKCDRDRPRKDC